MFTHVLRLTPPKNVDEVGQELWNKTRKLMQDTRCISLQRYGIVDGDHAGDRMIVLRFHNRAEFDQTHETIMLQWQTLLAEVERAGYIIQEVLMLDEILEPHEPPMMAAAVSDPTNLFLPQG